MKGYFKSVELQGETAEKLKKMMGKETVFMCFFVPEGKTENDVFLQFLKKISEQLGGIGDEQMDQC